MAGGFATAYGVDFAGDRLLVVRALARGACQPVVDAPVDAEEAVGALRAAAAEVSKGHAALAVCAPAAQTFIRRLRAPFASKTKAAKVWNALLDVELPFPIESAQCVFGPPQVDKGGTESIAVAIRKNDLETTVEACRRAGGDPTHCDAEALALWDQQNAEITPVRGDSPRAIVWLGADHVALARGRGTVFCAAHVLRISPTAGAPAGREAFESLWTARLPQILAAHLAETGAEGLDLWWAGPAAEDEAWTERLRRLLPVAGLRHATHRQPASFLARALARRALAASGVNFLMGARAHPALLRVQARAHRKAYLGVVAASLAILALNGVEAAVRSRRLAAVRQELAAAAQAIAGAAVVPGQEVLSVQRALPARDAETEAWRDALDPVGVEGRLAGVLREAAALGIQITHLKLAAAAMTMEGSAPEMPAIDMLGDRLRGQDWTIELHSPGLTSEGHPRFILKGTIRHEG